MNRIRRLAVLLGLTAVVIVGSSIPASATFSESVSTNTGTLGAGTVEAPTSVTATVTRCHPLYVDATITWPASTTQRGVSGYLVTMYLEKGNTTTVTQTDAATRSVSVRMSSSTVELKPQMSVTTLTSYGWSTESALSEEISC